MLKNIVNKSALLQMVTKKVQNNYLSKNNKINCQIMTLLAKDFLEKWLECWLQQLKIYSLNKNLKTVQKEISKKVSKRFKVKEWVFF